jgi:dTMP kinase
MSYRINFTSDFKRNIYPGRFIALEGLDGSGKTVQVKPLKDYFEKNGKRVILARAPRKDEGLLGAINQKILREKLIIPKQAFQYLFTADYIMQMEDIIIPALKNGDVVLTDRFVGWSAVAYGIWEQDEKYDISIAQSILAAHGVFTKSYQLIIPDMTLYLEVPITTAVKRLSEKGEAKEVYEEEKTLMKIRKGYKWLLQEFPEEFTIIDAERTIEEVTKDMIKVIEKKFSI